VKNRKYYDVTIKQGGGGNIDGKGIHGPEARKESLSHTFISAVDFICFVQHTRVASSSHWKGSQDGVQEWNRSNEMRMVRYEHCDAIEQAD